MTQVKKVMPIKTAILLLERWKKGFTLFNSNPEKYPRPKYTAYVQARKECPYYDKTFFYEKLGPYFLNTKQLLDLQNEDFITTEVENIETITKKDDFVQNFTNKITSTVGGARIKDGDFIKITLPAAITRNLVIRARDSEKTMSNISCLDRVKHWIHEHKKLGNSLHISSQELYDVFKEYIQGKTNDLYYNKGRVYEEGEIMIVKIAL